MKPSKVRFAVLHNVMFIPEKHGGCGQAGPTLEPGPVNRGSIKSMIKNDSELVVIMERTNKETTVCIPLTNVSHMVLDETNSKATDTES